MAQGAGMGQLLSGRVRVIDWKMLAEAVSLLVCMLVLIVVVCWLITEAVDWIVRFLKANGVKFP